MELKSKFGINYGVTEVNNFFLRERTNWVKVYHGCLKSWWNNAKFTMGA